MLVVHRPKYDDWAFPKGKLENGESWEEAAAREVEEETSLRCTPGEYIGSTHYELREGVKEVRYFRMSCEGEATPQNEVDELRWITASEGAVLLSYEYDRALLERGVRHLLGV